MNKERVKCIQITRCVGYLRPVENMNEGKQEEVKDRSMFDVSNKS